MEHPPKVSVIIPAFQAMDTLGTCLDCLQKQTYDGSFEVLVIDNGGNDDIDALCAQYDTVRCISEKTQGAYAARNTGIAHARGAILAFTDADCQPDSAWIASGVSRLESIGDRGIVAGHITVTLSPHPDASEYYEMVTSLSQKRIVQERKYAVTANMFVYATLFSEVGMFCDDLQSGGDFEWGTRASHAQCTLLYSPETIVFHPARSTWLDLVKRNRTILYGLAQKDHVERLSLSLRIYQWFLYCIWNLMNAVRIVLSSDISGLRLRMHVLIIWLGLQCIYAWTLLRLLLHRITCYHSEKTCNITSR